jgi:hypothetical protein
MHNHARSRLVGAVTNVALSVVTRHEIQAGHRNIALGSHGPVRWSHKTRTDLPAVISRCRGTPRSDDRTDSGVASRQWSQLLCSRWEHGGCHARHAMLVIGHQLWAGLAS